MLTERVFDTGQVTVNFVEGPPSGPPLVLIHGGGDRWQHFTPILPYLVLRWHVFALDLRGHGKSGRVPGQYRPEHYVADVTAWLDHHVSGQAILFGHSLGGWIALLVAAQQAGKVRALILGDPPLNLERFVAVEGSEERVGMWRGMRDLARAGLSVPELAAALPRPPGMDAARLQSWAKTLSQVDPDLALYHAEGRVDEYVQNVDLDAALQRVTCPVLLLQADPACGGMVLDGERDHALSLLSHGLYVQLPGATHNLGLSTWEVRPLIRAVVSFLESL